MTGVHWNRVVNVKAIPPAETKHMEAQMMYLMRLLTVNILMYSASTESLAEQREIL